MIRLLAGEQVPVAYDETVRELNANDARDPGSEDVPAIAAAWLKTRGSS